MKIYTKTGDLGETSLVGGVRVSKCCDRLEAYGTVDELNSFVGLLMTYCDDSDRQFLTDVQKTLFTVGSYLATDTIQTQLRETAVVTTEMIASVEREIDNINATLPPFKMFILPGGSRPASVSHVCRTVCRRAERCILRLQQGGVQVDPNVIAYVNRLSDYLFVLARRLNQDEGGNEIVWDRKNK